MISEPLFSWAKLQKQESVEVRNCQLQSVIAADGVLLLLDTTCFCRSGRQSGLPPILKTRADFQRECTSIVLINGRSEIFPQSCLFPAAVLFIPAGGG
jgi:hypothetical protein